jgi:predicted RNA-binding protein with PIN domain
MMAGGRNGMKDGRRSPQRGPERGRSQPPAEETQPERFLWIVDGHNAIFALAEYEALQLGGQKREARRALEDRLEAFGRAIGRRILIVYDGNQMERNPDAVSRPHVHTEYSLPPEEADDRIRFLAARALADRERPMVVTSDRRTLSGSLPPGTRHLDVEDFFRRVERAGLRTPEKWRPSGLDDVERFFLRNSPDPEDRRLAQDEGGAAGRESAPPAEASDTGA